MKESGAVEPQTAAEQAEEVTETTEVSETVFQIPENYAVVITVKINPELRIYLDENANVLAVEPVNEDAQELIAAMQLEGMTFETCMEKMIAHAHEMGYLKEDGTIQVTAEGDEEEFCSQILEKAKISISSVIEKENIKVSDKVLDTLTISIEKMNQSTTYTLPSFVNSYDAREVLDTILKDKAKNDRAAVLELTAQGMTEEDAVAQYDTEDSYQAWYQDTVDQINRILNPEK